MFDRIFELSSLFCCTWKVWLYLILLTLCALDLVVLVHLFFNIKK